MDAALPRTIQRPAESPAHLRPLVRLVAVVAEIAARSDTRTPSGRTGTPTDGSAPPFVDPHGVHLAAGPREVTADPDAEGSTA